MTDRPSTFRDTTASFDLSGAPTFLGDAAAVAAVPDGRVFVFNRGPQRMSIFDSTGGYLSGWGDPDEYVRPHGMAVAADGTLLLVDAGSHIVDKRSLDGELLMRIGEPGVASAPYSGDPFNQPTDVAEHPVSRELFVSDGYANSRIHRYDADGKHIASWGTPGSGPGDLSNPHGLCFVDDEHLAVCDRENYRIQFFSLDGQLVDSWHWHHPSSIRKGPDERLYIAELGPPPYMHGVAPDMGCCLSVVDTEGTVVDRIGATYPGLDGGALLAPHGLALTDAGDVYIAEVNAVYLGELGQSVDREDLTCLRRWSNR